MDFSCGYDCSEIRSSTVYETLHALKVKENESQYSAFLDAGNFSYLMQSYEAFDPEEAAGPAQVRYLTAGFLFQVVDFYGEEREVAIVAMSYLDRFLMIRCSQDDENLIINPRSLRHDVTNAGRVPKPARVLDVYALACLGIAIKLFSPLSGCPRRARKLRLVDCREESCRLPIYTSYYNGINNHSLVDLGGGLISAIDIANIELLILETLSYRLHPPTSYAFITNILRLVPLGKDSLTVMDNIFEFAKYQAELASLNAKALMYPPSLIAVSALCNAIHHHLSLLVPSHVQVPMLSHLLDYDTTETFHLLLSRMEDALELSLDCDSRISSLRNLLSYLMYGGKKNTARNCNRHVKSQNLQQKKTKKVLCHSGTRPATTKMTTMSTTNQHTNTTTNTTTTARKTDDSIRSLPRKRNHQTDSSTNFVSGEEWEIPDYCFLSLAFDSLLPDGSLVCPSSYTNGASVANNTKSEKWMTNEKQNQMNSDLIEYYNRYIKPQLYQQHKQHHNNSSLSNATTVSNDNP
eukprot:CAMPEP_0176501878 /NCGR_PEP_ID=MMETSP0200_2-20121128/14434_1 /TAXON_ID=947934 /ORGANISM="Chaetoceros sp., Strain GSL56" /LENGTH=520 /DNA_ID=CAMNT_0017900871 /DNA_START=1419 /DNA_END=2978 /DNA_ORIENTATION=-